MPGGVPVCYERRSAFRDPVPSRNPRGRTARDRWRMLPLAGFLLLLYCLWRGGHPIGVALLAAGVVIHLVLTLRLVKATSGGVGGHAEWVRDVETRPRMRTSPAWLLGSALVALGASLALFLR